MESNKSEAENNSLIETNEGYDTSIILNEIDDIGKLIAQIELKQSILLTKHHPKLYLWAGPWDGDGHTAEPPSEPLCPKQKKIQENECLRNLAANIFYCQREGYYHLNAVVMEYKKPACQKALGKKTSPQMIQGWEDYLKIVIEQAVKTAEKYYP